MTRSRDPSGYADDCRRFADRLSEYLDGELDTELGRRLRAHIRACRGCAACLETLRRTVEVCRRLEPPPPPGDFPGRLRRSLERFIREAPLQAGRSAGKKN